MEASAPVDAPAFSNPISLTASDGTGLKLVSLQVRAQMQAPLAFTELRMRFMNPEPRVREGRFAITLPPNASVSRFAMKIGGRWMEGEVVERQRARRVYEDFLHRRQDPALLEQASANLFSARVFPIPAEGEKEIVLSYSQVQRGDAPFRVALRGLPKIEKLDAALYDAGGRRSARLRRVDWTPDRDFERAWFTPDEARPVYGLRHENLVALTVTPEVEAAPAPFKGLAVVVDTSASGALVLGRQAKLTKRLLEALARGAPEMPVLVMAFDQAQAVVYRGAAKGAGVATLRAILDRRALGASDFGAAIAALLAQLDGEIDRVLVITDGTVTAGVEGPALVERVRELRQAGVRRLDALAPKNADLSTLRRLTTEGLPETGAVVDAGQPLGVIARRLTRRVQADVRLEVPGAKWVWPTVAPALQSGDRLVVYADVPNDRPVSVLVGGRPQAAPTLQQVERPLLERAWVGAQIARMLDAREAVASPQARRALNEQIVALSRTHRVLCPLTGLLVLETEEDYRRFGLERRATVDILALVKGRLTRVPHARAVLSVDGASSDPSLQNGPDGDLEPDGSEAPSGEVVLGAEPKAEARRVPSGRVELSSEMLHVIHGTSDDDVVESGAVGGLGTAGVGRGGGGDNDAVGFGSIQLSGGGRAAARRVVRDGRPRATANVGTGGPAIVGASLRREAIQRVMRRRFRAILNCYERELREDRDLAGRITVQFTIQPTGRVSDAQLGSTTINSERFEACVLRRVSATRFPRPMGGGIVKVTYPYTFSVASSPAPAPSGAAAPPPPPRPVVPPIEGSPWTGRFEKVRTALDAGDVEAAVRQAENWQKEAPGDVLALIAFGEAHRKAGHDDVAARAFGALIDLFPARADMRRHAGERLEALATPAALALAVDTYRRALKDRPDHPTTYRLLAFAQLRTGDGEGARKTMRSALEQTWPDRFKKVAEVFRTDAAQIERVVDAKAPKNRRTKIKPSTRFVLHWETDANDVDLHVWNKRGDHAYYAHPKLAAGAELYADVTQGYGPECFEIDGRPKSYPYTLRAHYYRMGPMGYGMGALHIVQFDPSKADALRFRTHPFVVMKDEAYVALGRLERPLR